MDDNLDNVLEALIDLPQVTVITFFDRKFFYFNFLAFNCGEQSKEFTSSSTT